jgi:hypothetical protein
VASNIYLPFKTRKKRNNKIKDKKVGDGRRFEERGKNSTDAPFVSAVRYCLHIWHICHIYGVYYIYYKYNIRYYGYGNFY